MMKSNLGKTTAAETLEEMKPTGFRYVIVEATMQVAMPVPTFGKPELAEFATNEAVGFWSNNEMDVVEEFIPALKSQMERDIDNLNRYHFNLKVLRDATEEDMKEFSVRPEDIAKAKK